jgi:hypothetical protein
MKLDMFDDASLLTLTGGLHVPATLTGLDSLENSFNEAAEASVFGFSPQNYWRLFKEEMITLICGPAPNQADPYAELRNELKAKSGQSQTVLVSTIAVFVAAKMGLEAGAIVPFVASFIAVGKRVGAAVFCRSIRNRNARS